jgi:hypothetical protein
MNVLTLARDRVHAGWSLLTHPLYGNVQPSQQLFRSVLVGLPYENSGVDHESLSILERAIGLYRSRETTSENPTGENRYLDDYAALDVYLLHDSMERYGLLKGQRPQR